MTMDWSKNAKKKSKASPTRKLCIPISNELERVLEFFRAQNPDFEFTDTAIIMTFIEAGIRTFAQTIPQPTEQDHG